MSDPTIVEEQLAQKEAPTSETAMVAGRSRYDAAMKKGGDIEVARLMGIRARELLA